MRTGVSKQAVNECRQLKKTVSDLMLLNVREYCFPSSHPGSKKRVLIWLFLFLLLPLDIRSKHTHSLVVIWVFGYWGT